ncbi:MAG: hypothetical protein RIC89_22545, partial [Pseudomonadales bacterium]
LVWQDELRSGSDATPMTYVSPTTGKQYVIVTVAGEATSTTEGDDVMGESRTNTSQGGKVIAYALPD